MCSFFDNNSSRQHSAYGDPGVTYTYSGVTVQAKPWTKTLQWVRRKVEEATGVCYNFVLVNRYKDGLDKMGEHRDDEKELCQEVAIASLSLGVERDFVFRHENSRQNKVEDTFYIA